MPRRNNRAGQPNRLAQSNRRAVRRERTLEHRHFSEPPAVRAPESQDPPKGPEVPDELRSLFLTVGIPNKEADDA